MKYLKIQNEGLLDIRLVHLMGGTTKATDDRKIGQFGTGMKYLLAYLLRNNIEFKIFIGEKEIEISTKKEIIRDTNFDIIYIDGERTSITTNMGTDWKGWMIVRELWCNAIDEKNGNHCVTDEISPTKTTTEFYIQNVGEIKKTVDNWGKYFIHGTTPLQKHKNFTIYKGGESLRLYKKGVLIKEVKDTKSVFSYDIHDATINELREFNGSISYGIIRILPLLDATAAEYFLNNVKDTFEDSMDYDWSTYDKFGKGWKEAIGSAKIVDHKTYDKMVNRYPELEKQAIVKVPKGLFKKLYKEFPTISLVRVSDTLNTFFETYSDELNDNIKNAIAMLSGLGYFIDPNLKILIGVFGDTSVLAQVSFDDKEIRISQELESLPFSKLLVALVEENEHYKTGFQDMTREFQTHLIELYVTLLTKEVKILL